MNAASTKHGKVKKRPKKPKFLQKEERIFLKYLRHTSLLSNRLEVAPHRWSIGKVGTNPPILRFVRDGKNLSPHNMTRNGRRKGIRHQQERRV